MKVNTRLEAVGNNIEKIDCLKYLDWNLQRKGCNYLHLSWKTTAPQNAWNCRVVLLNFQNEFIFT